jgi:hypothetical protein
MFLYLGQTSDNCECMACCCQLRQLLQPRSDPKKHFLASCAITCHVSRPSHLSWPEKLVSKEYAYPNRGGGAQKSFGLHHKQAEMGPGTPPPQKRAIQGPRVIHKDEYSSKFVLEQLSGPFVLSLRS